MCSAKMLAVGMLPFCLTGALGCWTSPVNMEGESNKNKHSPKIVKTCQNYLQPTYKNYIHHVGLIIYKCWLLRHMLETLHRLPCQVALNRDSLGWEGWFHAWNSSKMMGTTLGFHGWARLIHHALLMIVDGGNPKMTIRVGSSILFMRPTGQECRLCIRIGM